MNFLMILIIIILCFCICSCIGAYYELYIVENVPSFLPSSFQFSKSSDTKYIGHAFQQLTDISESDCLPKCVSNPFCIGATYDTKKSVCSLQWQNLKTRPSFSTAWTRYNSYSILNPQNAVEIKTGFKSNGTGVKSNPSTSLNDCIQQCIGDDPDCKSANFNTRTKMCDFLPSNTDMGDQLSADSNYTYIGRKGLVGNACKSNDDCIYGLCRNNICLIGSPLQSGEQCKTDGDCISGQCISETISFADQEVERQQLLNSGDPTTVACDSYKTCHDCQEVLVNAATSKDPAKYTGAKCIWRYSQDLSDDILNKLCKDREPLIPTGVTSKCFPKTIVTNKKTCK